MLLIVTGTAPSVWNRSLNSGPFGTRILMPCRSAGTTTGRVTAVICRMPLSKAPTGNPWMPLAAISSRM